MEDADATGRYGHDSLVSTYWNTYLKGRFNHTSRSGVIAVFAILTSPTREVENNAERSRLGPIPLDYISKIDVQDI